MNDAPGADDGPTVLAHTDCGIIELTMSYVRRRNALAGPVKDGLIRHLEAAMQDPAVRVVLLTGAGGHFCAGGDLSGMEGTAGMAGRARMAQTHRLIRLMVLGEKPVIAAVEGHAAGAGLSLAAGCDLVVASRAATFTCSFNRVGLVPDLGAAWTLPRRMGLGAAKLLMLTGRPMGAEQAAQAGIVDVLSNPGQALSDARALAREIAERAPLSNAMTKSLLSRSGVTLEDLLRAEADAQGLLYGTADFQEGKTAFAEKRVPRFSGS